MATIVAKPFSKSQGCFVTRRRKESWADVAEVGSHTYNTFAIMQLLRAVSAAEGKGSHGNNATSEQYELASLAKFIKQWNAHCTKGKTLPFTCLRFTYAHLSFLLFRTNAHRVY